MDAEQRTQRYTKDDIYFPNGNRAQLVAPPDGTSATDLIHTLGTEESKALILIVGGAAGLDEALKPRLIQLFSRAIARAAAETDALIIDGGTQTGVMAMMGQGVADRGRKSALLGVAPAGRVTYPGGPNGASTEDVWPLDPNHSHFVLVESDEWGGETETMFELATTLGKGIPVVTVLVNGGLIARDEVLRSVRHGWPIIILEDSGRLADEISNLLKEKPPSIDEPVMAEIVADGDIYVFPPDGSIAGLKRLILRKLGGESVVKLAWERFALYDKNAKRQQISFDRLQASILTIGVLGTLLALTQATLRSAGLSDDLTWLDQVLHYVIVIVPITVAALVAAANSFKAGNKWVLLRASAEAIKREIYRYRSQAEIYSDKGTAETSREAKLASKVKSISRRLMQTEVNFSALRPYKGPIPPQMYGAAKDDDGLSFLSPDRYIAIRLGDQLNYYRGKTAELERRSKLLQWLIYIVGGVGTFLAAVGLELWIALTTGLVAAFTTYLGYRQVENTLMIYNQAATNLANVQGWWLALSSEGQARPENLDKLVKHTEKTLRGELAGWVQTMEDALVELSGEQAGEGSGTDSN